ncbi:hypothetical protein CEXT_467251 [Caerostris extrusa]|uniref:LAGLIDADG homing endonuclease n=1 Tax=Caerostris extrusa TaxID=172846 RepID=A0AAV4X363_CAEEX|nr:hypothetical protein CEXT_467251 [Caerostris extrusa]
MTHYPLLPELMKLYVLITNPGYRGGKIFSHIPPKHFPGPLFSLCHYLCRNTVPKWVRQNFRRKICGLMKNSVTEFFWVCVVSSRKITYKLNRSHGRFETCHTFLGKMASGVTGTFKFQSGDG